MSESRSSPKSALALVAVVGVVAALAVAALLWTSPPTPPPTDAATTPTAEVPTPEPVVAAGANAPHTDAAEAAPATPAAANADVDAAPDARTEVAAGETTKFAVHGQLLDEDGKPVDRATIAAMRPTADFDSKAASRPLQKPLGRTSTDANGRFRIDGLVAGTVRMVAMPQQRRRDAGVPWANGEVTGKAGEEIEWNVRLQPAPMISGRARWRSGEPIADARVTIVPTGSPMTATALSTTTKEDGTFRFCSLEVRAYDVVVTPAIKLSFDDLSVAATGIWPDRAPLDLVATSDVPTPVAMGTVRGRVVDSGHRLVKGAKLGLALVTDGFRRTDAAIDAATFTFTDVVPGRYQVMAYGGDEPIAHCAWFAVGEGELVDVGAITTEPACSLLLRVARGECKAPLDGFLQQDGVGDGRSLHFGTRNELRVDNLSPGRYRLRVWGNDSGRIDTAIDVAQGNATTVQLELRPAATRTISLTFAASRRLQSLLLREQDGTVYGDYRFDTPPPSPWHRVLALPIGSFTAAVTLDDGSSHTLAFAIVDLENKANIDLDVGNAR